MNDDTWMAVGAAIAERMEELHFDKADMVRKSGISRKTLDGYISGQPIVAQKKRWGLCAVLRWTDDSIERIRRGEEPVERGADVGQLEELPTVDLMEQLNELQAFQRSVIEELARRSQDR